MAFTVEASVPAPPDAVWAWWTDFGEVGEAMLVGHGLSLTRRRIVAREGATTRMHEEAPFLPWRWTIMRREAEADDAARTIHERILGRAVLRSTWRFEPDGAGGTRVTRVVGVRGEGRLWRLVAAADLRHHARQCARELARAAEVT